MKVRARWVCVALVCVRVRACDRARLFGHVTLELLTRTHSHRQIKEKKKLGIIHASPWRVADMAKEAQEEQGWV